jgi:hypothetical protein
MNPIVMVTTVLITAVFNNPLNRSNITCVKENTIYINAGGHISIPSTIFM